MYNIICPQSHFIPETLLMNWVRDWDEIEKWLSFYIEHYPDKEFYIVTLH